MKEELGSVTALLGELGKFLILYGSLFPSPEMRGLGKVIPSSKYLLPPTVPGMHWVLGEKEVELSHRDESATDAGLKEDIMRRGITSSGHNQNFVMICV